jgi:putative transcriptional regulator
MIRLKLEELVEERGSSFYRLSVDSGIGHSTISKLRHETVKAVRLDVLDALCVALDCQPGDILVHIPDKKGVALASKKPAAKKLAK